MNKMWTVLAYSFKERIRSKSFKVMTLIVIAAILLLTQLPKWLGGGGEAQTQGTVAVIDESNLNLTAEGLSGNVSPLYTWQVLPAEELDAQTALLKDDKLEGVVRVNAGDGAPQVTLVVDKSEDASFAQPLMSYVGQAYTASEVGKLNLDAGEARQITAPPVLDLQELNAGGKSFAETFMPVYLLLFLLYFMIYLFAGNVATSISVEKGSRIKEILITKVSPGQLLTGKLLGVGLAGILQFALIFGVGAALIRFAGGGEGIRLGAFSVDFSILGGGTLAVTALVFVLGYFFYAALFGAAGSLVSRSEELNQAIMPVSILLMASFFAGMMSMNDPNGTLAVAGSYIPFLTPLVLIARVGAGELAPMEIMVPLLILAASTVLVAWLSSRIYRAGVLLYGQKPSLGMMLRALGSGKRGPAVSASAGGKTTSGM
ncbi:ABC transporter permease [Saccharibacillus sp. CPCC 101409]|uniref:ABC transporter permease n=1 Tax=Saccharibacillus sp. CPCC 101409 TaxID=3058041 RepID=UPI002671F1A7|nr:ABC transporter permease [Saccharibacillus sp. CPCC 101409]MDO3411361.1 ABC transporter permease [Saccharibacillus sp. CPCC 101409]